ncbi:MAG: hypothetical protein HYT29_02265 [Parcubacteria group bacterium]|nr:hypothetical protein [Parcubacteria group bacterium]
MSKFTNTKTAKFIGMFVAVLMFAGVAVVPVAHALTLAELVELFIALEIIPVPVYMDTQFETRRHGSRCHEAPEILELKRGHESRFLGRRFSGERDINLWTRDKSGRYEMAGQV